MKHGASWTSQYPRQRHEQTFRLPLRPWPQGNVGITAVPERGGRHAGLHSALATSPSCCAMRPWEANQDKDHRMPRMTGGEAIVDSLLRHGIDTVFGLPGVQTYGLFDAFARASNSLRLINARHEQTTAYMALGYACATGRP